MNVCPGTEEIMKTKNFKKIAALVCVICLVCANVLIVYANEQSKKEEEMSETQNEVILPPSHQVYVAYRFDIDLPTCVGSGEYKLSQHYFDPVYQYGYPASMKFSMSTSGTCDFGAHVWAYDMNEQHYDVYGGSSQSNGMIAERKFLDLNMILFAENTPKYPSTAWVCDEEDLGVFYNIRKTNNEEDGRNSD